MKHSKTTPINFPAPLRVEHDHDGEQDLWLVRAPGGDIVASCQCPDAAAHIVRCVSSHEALVGALRIARKFVSKHLIGQQERGNSVEIESNAIAAIDEALRLAEASEDDTAPATHPDPPQP
jgi:hypothetical protein